MLMRCTGPRSVVQMMQGADFSEDYLRSFLKSRLGAADGEVVHFALVASALRKVPDSEVRELSCQVLYWA